jgi:CRISPR-associated protein Cas6
MSAPSATPIVEMRFHLWGDRLPVDHGYALYAAVARHLDWIHADSEIGLAPVRGVYGGGGELLLREWSRLSVRTPVAKLPALLALAGRTLDIGGRRLRVGVPTTHALTPAATLYAHLVTTKNGADEARFDAEIKRQLTTLNISGRFERGARRTFSVHGRQIVGYSLLVSELDAEASIAVQEVGLGGRRKMGCGAFFPLEGGIHDAAR